jgi:DNA-directed RNA polymerase specialized sigma24 family protein
MTTENPFVSELALRDSCLDRNETAWTELFGRCEGPLVQAILQRLPSPDPNRAEHVAEEVWYRLIHPNMHRLRAFDPRRGPFLGYLVRMARSVIKRLLASHSTPREVPLTAAPAQTWQGFLCSESAVAAEFLKTLSPTLRHFCRRYVLEYSPGEEAPINPANYRQRMHRLRRAFRRYLNAN